VWLAEHLILHAPIAIKLIAREVAESRDGLQRFLREARLAASLRSPHVVQILDYGVQQGVPYIAMELLDGESLAQRLARVRRLSLSQTELVLRHVGRAVGRAHDLGIVHRDLKPSNIYIVRNEDEELIKLLDFGVAKSTRDEPTPSVAAHTRTGAFLGTPFYVSPEQARGSRSVDHRTDIWAIGVIAFECVLGQPPFTADTFGNLVDAICTLPMPVPSQRGAVPPGFDGWFARACAREIDARFPNVREAIAELRRVLDPGAIEIAAARTRTSLTAPPEPVLAAVRAAPAEAERPWPGGALGVTTAAASSSSVASRPAAGMNVNVARFAGGAVFVAAATALWIAWRSSSGGRPAERDTNVWSALPESSRGDRPAAAPAPSTGTRAAIVVPPGAAPPRTASSPGVSPPGSVSSSAVPLDAVPLNAAPASAGTASGPHVAFVAEPVPLGVSASAPPAARKPRQATKSAATRGPHGSPASATSRPRASTRPGAALDDIALEAGPRAPSAPQKDPGAAKHNLGF